MKLYILRKRGLTSFPVSIDWIGLGGEEPNGEMTLLLTVFGLVLAKRKGALSSIR